MDVSAIITRLRDQLSGFVAIGGAAELDAAIENTPGTPAAYVLPLAETGAEPDLLGIYRQRLTHEFAVVLVLGNLRDPLGAAASIDLASKRGAVRAALAGWAPNADGEPVIFSGGALLMFQEQRLWWRDEFRVRSEYRSA
ncbi:MAG: Gp37 family protein [Burkholderiaceae bacterium]|jgi:hypothetical protein|nr:Gp37 family protein [Burkholderiaceae bacterium]